MRLRTKAVILAGGVGSRLRPITDHTPKCLVPIAGRPLLDYWLDALRACHVRDVLINTHHLADRVRAHVANVNSEGFHISETYEPELRGSAGTVAANRSWMDDADQCLLIYADNLSNVDLAALLNCHVNHGDPLTMMLFRPPEPRRCGIAELDSEHRVISFVEKPQEPKTDLANAGVYVVTADAYREIADMKAFDFGFEVLPRFIGRMRGWVNDHYHRDIGTLEALEEAERVAGRIFGAPGAPS